MPMKALTSLGLLTLFFAACSSTPVEDPVMNDPVAEVVEPVIMTVPYHTATLTYDGNVWLDNGYDGLERKADGLCYIDLTGDFTKPAEGWDYELTTQGELTVYNWAGSPSRASFALGVETVYGWVSSEDQACVDAYADLAEMNP